MQYEQVITMIKEVAKLGMSSFTYSEGELHISMTFPERALAETQPGLPAPSPSLPADVQPEESALEGMLVTSPLVGTFYAAPSEESAPFVKVGDRVKKGQTLAIVEAMKLMNEIACEQDGTVQKIYVENKTAVEFGQPLFCIAAAPKEMEKNRRAT